MTPMKIYLDEKQVKQVEGLTKTFDDEKSFLGSAKDEKGFFLTVDRDKSPTLKQILKRLKDTVKGVE